MKDFKKRLMEWKPSSPGELPDRYTDAACEYIDEEPSSPRYEGERQVVAVFTDPNTNKQFKSKPVPYNSLVSSKMARMGYKKACRLAKQQARKSLEENNVKITKNELADIILEETRAIMQENKSTGLDHAQKLAREVMRMFYDNNERDGIVSALMNAGNIDGAEKAVLARRAVDDLVDTLEGNEQQENLEEAKNCGCGQDPCITYGKIKEGNVKMKMTKSKLQQIILEETKKVVEEGAVPGQISGGDLVAAITLAIDEVFQDTRPDHEAAAIAYAQISNSLDEIFRQSYKASARLGKMMGGSPEEPGELGGLGLE